MINNDELINKVFFKKYKILKKIGKGSFGLVYLGKVINSNNYVAMKFEPKNQPDLILERESYLLYYLRGYGIPEVITYGHNSKYNILIQTLLGNSVNDIFIKHCKKFSMKDCCMLGIQMLDRLEYIHSKYIIHRDIKPDNYLLGNPDTSLIYLIDFGLAKKYMSSRTGKHVKFAINKKWSGTSRFASANSLRGVVQSRRDDLESLCYILLLIMKGNLPWDNVFGYSENEDILLIYKIKKYMKPELLFLNLPKEIIDFFKYCKNLDFEQKPDYAYLRSLLLDILKSKNEKNDLFFSWKMQKKLMILDNRKKDELPHKYSKINQKRKGSPQQRLYHSLIKNIVNKEKRSESLNELYLNKEKNRLKRDFQPIKNISPSPKQVNKINNLYNEMKKENFKHIKAIPNRNKQIVLESINLNLKNNSLNENIILKSQTQGRKKELLDKRINIIPLQKFGKRKTKKINKEDNDKNDKIGNILILSKRSFFEDKINNIYNKIFIKKNKSFDGKENKEISLLNINPNFKEYKRLIDNIKNEREDCNNNSKQIIKDYKALDYIRYKHKENKKKNLVLNNSFLNPEVSYNNIFQHSNNSNINNKISNLNLTNINNIIMVPKKENYIKYNHLSSEQQRRINIKMNQMNQGKIRENLFTLNRNKYIQYKTNQYNLISDKINVVKNINNFKNDDNSMNSEIRNNKNYPKNSNIKIINIIAPINKASSFYKIKKNSFSSRTNLYKDNNKIKKNNNNKHYIINNFYSNNDSIYNNKGCNTNASNNNQSDLLSDYFSTPSLLNDYKKQEYLFYTKKTSNFTHNDKSLNSYRNDIFKSNSCFMSKKLNSFNQNNYINLKFKKTSLGNSLSYVSPKSIEKIKLYN